MSSIIAKALGSLRTAKAGDRGTPAGVAEVARTWGQNKLAYRIRDPHDRAVPGRTGKVEVVWEPEPKKEVVMTVRDYDAIFPADRGLPED